MDKDKLISEEQKILNQFITRLDQLIDYEKDRKESADYGISHSLTPEAYSAFLEKLQRVNIINADINNLINGKDALYEYRINLSYKSSDGSSGKDELKITKMTPLSEGENMWDERGNDVLMCSWKNPIVRPYILDQELVDYPYQVHDKFNGEVITNYHLELKRKIDIRFEKVKNVEHMFPLTVEEAEKVLGDVFLAELVKKRSDKDFTDIIFTIQKKQGEIIRQEFNKNIIVQGCAGSGKSMIMLHRLPILLYDKCVNKSNVFIISPSQSYIQMVNNMRKQLEINDIAMGTLDDYYQSVIGRYKFPNKPYDGIDLSALPWNVEKYIYSDDAISDIKNFYSDKINSIPYDTEKANNIFNEKPQNTLNNTWNEILSKRIININSILTANNKVINGMFKAVRAYMARIADLNISLSRRVQKIITEMNNALKNNENAKSKAEFEIKELDESENSKAIQNRVKIIGDAENEIHKIKRDLETIENDTDYQDYLSEICDLAKSQLKMFDGLDNIFENNDTKTLYMLFYKYHALESLLNDMLRASNMYEEKYLEYIKPLNRELNQLSVFMKEIKMADKPKLDYHYYKHLKESFECYTKLSSTIISDAYFYIIEKSGYKFNAKRKNVGIACSSYILLCLLYLYYGTPNLRGENLIAIDEAQNLAPNEFQLIKNVNNNKVVLNVFGDVKQHIENTKGLNSWSEINDFESYSLFVLNENYRNASQITKYCNNKFLMNMLPINLDGTGVMEYMNFSDFSAKMEARIRKLSGTGLSVIIVANADEAKDIKEKFVLLGTYINDLTNDNSYIYENKWNLMTVGQAKGLEFKCAIVIISNMTENEKYIACTRALDEMIVYCGEYIVKKSDNSIIPDNVVAAAVTISAYADQTDPKIDMKKEQDKISISSENQKFFEEAGLKILDERDSGGELWLIGDENASREIIMKARSIFRISSIQYGEKAPGLSGWHTKSKNI